MKLELFKPFYVEKICIIGIGLIGGCLAQALKANKAVGHISVYDHKPEALKNALEMGVADSVFDNVTLAVANADIIILSTPITAMASILKEIMPHLKEEAVISDVGGTKGSVVDNIKEQLGFLPARFVPAHPIAGTEKHGVENSFSTLFNNRRVLITPHVENNHDAVVNIRKMWESTGASVEEMGIIHHDQVLAATSHLPHLLAFATVDTLANLDDRAEIFKFAAGGFRDFTRISTSDPNMWADICLNNQEALLQVLNAYQAKINTIKLALEERDRPTIYETFRRAKHARDNFYHEP